LLPTTAGKFRARTPIKGFPVDFSTDLQALRIRLRSGIPFLKMEGPNPEIERISAVTIFAVSGPIALHKIC
jgi:hypothetical protein